MNSSVSLLLILLVLASGPASVWAVSASDLPSGSSAEVIEAKAKKESKDRLLQKKPPEKIEIETQQKPKAEKAAVSFYVENINLEGEEIIPFSRFDAVLSKYENKELTFSDLQDLSNVLEQEYRKQGYFVVVYVPPQRVENKQVTLRVVISRMGELDIEGQRWFRKNKIRSYWSIKKGEVIRFDNVQSGVRAMNENPDRNVHPIFNAGKEVGTTDVLLKVADRFPLHGGYSFDDRGVKLTGKQRHGFTLRHNNLLSLDDTFLIGTVFGRTYGAIFLYHLIPLNRFGTKLVYGFSHAQVNPKKEFTPFGINSISQTYNIGLLQKLFENDRISSSAHIGFDFKEKSTRSLSVTTTWDRLRVMTFGGETQIRDSMGSWGIGQDFSFGLPFRGDGYPLTSRGAESSFFKYNFSLQRLQYLLFGSYAMLSTKGQVSPNKLTPQEEVFLGGATTVRGYPESDYGADQAILSSIELHIPTLFFPADWKIYGSDLPLRQQIQMVSFLDHGYGRLRDPSLRERRGVNMLGIGGGLAVQLIDHVSARFEWGAAIGDHPLTEGGRSQFHFRLQMDS